jgi:hypothetical protein
MMTSAPEQRGPRPAEHRLGGRVEFDDMALVIGGDQRRQGMVDDRGLQRFGRLELLDLGREFGLALLQLGDVATEGDDRLDLALAGHEGQQVLLVIAQPAAAVVHPALPAQRLTAEQAFGDRQVGGVDRVTQHLAHMAPDHLRGIEAHRVEEGVVGVEVVVVAADGRRAHRDVVEQGLQDQGVQRQRRGALHDAGAAQALETQALGHAGM